MCEGSRRFQGCVACQPQRPQSRGLFTRGRTRCLVFGQCLLTLLQPLFLFLENCFGSVTCPFSVGIQLVTPFRANPPAGRLPAPGADAAIDVGCSTGPTSFRVFCSYPHPERAPGSASCGHHWTGHGLRRRWLRDQSLPRMPRGDAAGKWRSRGNFLLAPGLSIERRRQIVKRPTWLRWQAGEARSDHLKRVRRLTDQRMKRQEAQKRDEAERGKARAANGSAAPELVS